MLRMLMVCCALAMPTAGLALPIPEVVADAVEGHILPRYGQLVQDADTLAQVAQDACGPTDTVLIAAFHDAFDAWISVSHITFGPAEVDGRAFALAFWPDTRGMTGRSLSGLIANEDPVVGDPADYATVSVAARGFHALDFLLFDPQVSVAGDGAYRCALVQAITTDIAQMARAIQEDWTEGFANLMRTAGSNERFQSPEEAARALFSALTTGLEFTADLRIGRPMGSFDAPRPNRAEARRSGRSLRHVELSLEALADLARILSQDYPELQAQLTDQFDTALDRARTLDDPVFAGVADPSGRLRIEVLQQRIRDARALAATDLGPTLGVAAGFNSLDGD
ncbi:imelysin family protein [Jannaschia sp. CCS1]|uniref:imelysin family protein n=1 Tax=Jannaschia sp. (strain CCS1) TaxID=290400 RepID=UPI000053CAB9|nr:imelysin family protein [Jannaschia sp. CCS1]ABD54287.1 hypothetical protein Jann_1370 [Jannaschia sp. CCS1]